MSDHDSGATIRRKIEEANNCQTRLASVDSEPKTE